METKFTPEQIEKARAAKSPEELLSLAKENGLELSAEQANAYFEKLNRSGELSDDELSNVAGGGCSTKAREVSPYDSCPKWRCKDCNKSYEEAGEKHSHGTIVRVRLCHDCKFYYYDPEGVRNLCSNS